MESQAVDDEAQEAPSLAASLPPGEPGSKRHLLADPLQLSADEMRMLLGELHRRLGGREAKASIYVVGGAALALTGDREQLTPDIDAVANITAVWEEARFIAEEYGLPVSWINANAKPYIPPFPSEVLEPPTKIGLTIHYAPKDHLLAMKMVALRPKDGPDIERLLVDLDLLHAEPEVFVDLLYRVYAGEGRIEEAMAAPGGDPDAAREEAFAIGRVVARIAQALSSRDRSS